MKKACIVIILVPLASVAYADVIYDDQTYNYINTETIFSIWGDRGDETADDFETTEDWTLEPVRFWLFYTGEQNIRVDIFSNGADDKPAAPPPGDLFYEEVPAESITWTDTGDSMFDWPIFEVDIPISGFDIIADTRYWLGLQSTSGGNSYWLQFMFTDWWEGMCFYDGVWHRAGEGVFESYDCEFELHGTPVDTGVTPESLGLIKAGYR